MRRVYVLGAGAEAQEAVRILRWQNHQHPLPLDFSHFVERGHGELGKVVCGVPIKGYLEALAECEPLAQIVNAIANPALRAKAAAICGTRWRYLDAIHQNVWLPDGASGAEGQYSGMVILSGVIIGAQVEIGNHVLIGPGAIIQSGATLCDYATIGAGAIIGQRSYIGMGGWIGDGAVITSGKRVGKWAAVKEGMTIHGDVRPAMQASGSDGKTKQP